MVKRSSVAAFGWTYLSRDAVRKAEAQMASDTQGVRDEIGFLHIHQGYADRFFPGTSVLQLRLRYVLFVPWMYQGFLKRPPRGDVRTAVRDAEQQLVKRLSAESLGVIGRDSPNNIAVQPPSLVYWGALSAWGLLRTTDAGRYFTRAEVHAAVAAGKIIRDDDGTPLRDHVAPFNTLPAPPLDWESCGAVCFALTPTEQVFLRGRWKKLSCPNDHLRPALLARLAEHVIPEVLKVPACWSDELVELADEEAPVLRRAQAAASLAAVGRAVYAALVEEMRETKDSLPTPTVHRDQLNKVIDEHADLALTTDLDQVAADIGGLPVKLRPVLESTLAWLNRSTDTPSTLLPIFRHAEWERKGLRSRLSEQASSQKRREEWDSNNYQVAQPLHYRWYRVRQMLADLYGQP